MQHLDTVTRVQFLKAAGEQRMELERLQAELADLKSCHKEHYEGMLAATAENERLRGALREIRDFGHASTCRRTVTPVYECGCYARSQAEIARDALEEGDDTE